jgi:hypothetical protein
MTLACGWASVLHAQQPVADVPETAATDFGPRTRWHDAYATLLDVDFGDSGFHARWQFYQCRCGDLLVRVEQGAPDGVETGELLLLNRRLLLARGGVANSEDLAYQLQAPALMVQLAFGLLQRAIPGGPGTLTEEFPLDLVERSADLQVETGAFSGTFNAPWQMQGKAWPSGPQRRRFDFEFSFNNPLPDAPAGMTRISFSGGQDFGRDDYPLADATPMTGWKMQWLDQDNAPVTDPEEGQTLEDLRKLANQPLVD